MITCHYPAVSCHHMDTCHPGGGLMSQLPVSCHNPAVSCHYTDQRSHVTTRRSHVTIRINGLMSQPGGLMSLQYVHHFLYCFYKKLIHSPSISLISLLLIRNPFGHMSNSFCPICCERFNASNRKHIRCPFLPCSKSACRSCYQSFLCSEHLTTPQCIFCHTLFTHSQLQHIDLPKSFLHGPFAYHIQLSLLGGFSKHFETAIQFLLLNHSFAC